MMDSQNLNELFSAAGNDPPMGTRELSSRSIALQRFCDRTQAGPDEDWSGISDPKVRRRLQNRLNQRARRSREKKQIIVSSSGKTNGGTYSSTTMEHHSPMIHILEQIEQIHILEADFVETQTKMRNLEAIARSQYMLGSPRTDLLLHLIQFNFTKALMENTKVLGLTSAELHDDAISPFNTAGPRQYDFGASLPPGLQPTMVQRTVPHHPWLDLIPISQMRDNLISAGESYDETQLCLDLKGCGSGSTGYSGIVVWRDPWDPTGWEVTENFAHTWGWVIQDCSDLFRSTNYWRAQRNERPLFPVL